MYDTYLVHVFAHALAPRLDCPYCGATARNAAAVRQMIGMPENPFQSIGTWKRKAGEFPAEENPNAYFDRELEREAKEFIRDEYLTNPESDSEIYSAADMVNAWRAGYDKRADED